MKYIFGILFLFISQLTLANSLSNSITSSTVGSADQVKSNEENDSRGREYKAGDAQRQGNTGMGMAIATGAALAARAVPLLMSIIPFEQAAGADLMAKAGLEFAQAGASGASAAKNKDQKTLLTKYNESNPGVSGGQASGAVDGRSINAPGLDQLLIDKGLNPDDFKNRLANGEFKNGSDILAAMGNGSSFTPEELEQGASFAAGEFNSILGGKDPKGEMTSVSSNYNEKTDIVSDPMSGSKGESFASYSSEHPTSGDSAQDSRTHSLAEQGASQFGDHSKQPLSAKNGQPGQTEGFDAAGLIKNMLNSTQTQNAKAMRVEGIARINLEKAGILEPKSRGNIFQTAHRNFKSFGKWRRTTKLASNR